MLEQKLKKGDFVITAEIVPPLSGDRDDLFKRVAPLAGLVDAVNLTDGAGARLAMSSTAASALLVAEGFEPILQMTCRDRNTIGLASDLLGASAQGIKNLLILRGDDPAKGDMPTAKAVFDIESSELISMASDLQGTLGKKGREITSPPEFFIGCADAPHDPASDWQPDGLRRKIAAGAQFAQTQFCFDIDTARNYFARLNDLGITQQLKFIVGIGPLLSLRQARFMNENLFGVTVPERTLKRLEEAGDQKAEGQKICIELARAFKGIAGISGVHIMAPQQNGETIAQVVKSIRGF
ncbi:5,10-methylenetetrahydrofolate reductase [hydrothermal vent metagenome]|uniref:5,10-methylenetetrahydrofolate reductase n=1 Tax=hydrothermal vent metagenome TaxID=652676 RepID=A0A3B0RS57_9ZZZZ